MKQTNYDKNQNTTTDYYRDVLTYGGNGAPSTMDEAIRRNNEHEAKRAATAALIAAKPPQPIHDSPTTDLNFEDFLIDLSDVIPEPHPLISIGETPTCSPGNLSTIKAPSKAGKTFLSAIIAAAWLRGEPICGVTAQPLPDRKLVFIIDTEQSKSHVHRFVKRVHSLIGLPDNERNHPYLKVCYLKEIGTLERKSLLEQIAELPDVGLIIVDGIIDLVMDFNNLEESTILRDDLLQLVGANDLHIICIIHQNKMNAHSRGHVGSILEQKSESVFQLSKDGEVFTVQPAYTRNQPFDEMRFRIDPFSGLPELYQVDSKKEKAEHKALSNYKIFHQILFDREISHSDLVTEIMERAGVQNRSARYKIGEAINKAWIKKASNGVYYLNISQNVLENENNDIPF